MRNTSYFLNVQKCIVNVWFVGVLPYQPTFRIQQLLAARHVKATSDSAVDTILIVEHTPGTNLKV